ncbi:MULTISPECIES: cystathionine beta-lyase [unclassified Pseudomonas]|uniref:cystathionine beta-lyase n=1 Tax=unclassified Pseudomonas TaxID=196821 RepID=UPI001622B2B7|nr:MULTISPECIES: cystathionine beta-lyase [unclassified Pseudomonas]MBB6286202.1 cystathionine beta-lyase [Pseudomonas sp. SJZ073]MBB6311873.1 cystathionine beta-lyase [Pseudomonas sp. JAI120]
MHHPDTLVVNTGRNSERFGGLINTPVFRGSTILVPSFDAWEACKRDGNPYAHYGRFGTETTRAFESAIAELEGGYASLVFPSGLSACTHAVMAFVAAGDHILITDNVYGPTRMFADRVLTRLGVEVEYFNPINVEDLTSKLRKNTSVVFIESPGSLTFEISDVRALSNAAHSVGAKVLLDNTWATPLYFKPFDHGVDISIQAATKYIVGHSDALLGTATANEGAWEQLQASAHDFGETAGPDDIFLGLRGIRSLSVRLQRHWENGLALAQCLQTHPAVAQVHHPALANDPSHDLWTRDFRGASGLFSLQLKSTDMERVRCFFDSLKHFGIGLSWGGYESLVLPIGKPSRTVQNWEKSGYLVRVHAGLENLNELQSDMIQALDQVVKKTSVNVA